MSRGRFTPEQVTLLSQPIDPNRVKTSQGQSHLEGWDVRAHLTRIFGFDGWDEEILSLVLVAEDLGNPLKPDKKQWYVTYRCTMRLVVWGTDDAGQPAIAKITEEGAIGGADNQPSRSDAHDLAMKEAMTQALKRCAINLGNQFGLSLYSNGSVASVAAVIETVPDGALRKDEAMTRVANAVKAGFPKSGADYIKATARGIWTEAEADKHLTDINGAPYLLATDVEVLDSITKETITGLLEAPTAGAA